MSNIKNKFALAAIAIFAAHPKIEEIYITADNQGFTDEEKAKDNARYHKDNSVEHFKRGFEESFKDEDETKASEQKADDGERAALAEKYEELFGKKPNHNTGVDKLKTQIAEKEAELAGSANPPQV